jgi:hypothetical protein
MKIIEQQSIIEYVMKTISQEVLSAYRAEKLEVRTPLVELPFLVGHLINGLPSRAEIYEEIFSETQTICQLLIPLCPDDL